MTELSTAVFSKIRAYPSLLLVSARNYLIFSVERGATAK